MQGPTRAIGPALLGCSVLLAACAVMEAPPGGPEDRTPPWVVAVSPDSAARGLGRVQRLSVTFSEKMDRKSATGWLFFFPDQRIRKTRWKGAIRAEIELEEPLPADTVIVVEIAPELDDAHRVPMRTTRRFPLATGDALPAGRITGILVAGDSAVTKGVVELYAVPPDSLEYFQQPVLRRTATASDGTFVFDWLPVPGGPWLLRAFADRDGNRRPGEREPKRLLGDTLSLDDDAPAASAGVTTLYAVDAPGRLLLPPGGPFGDAGPLMAWASPVGDVDTLWSPQPVAADAALFVSVAADTVTVLPEVPPGVNLVGVFLDADADSAFGAVPDSLLAPVLARFAWTRVDSVADTTGWYLEPLLLWESPPLEPGLAADLAWPDSAVILVPWPRPEPAAPDTAASDTLAPAPAPEEP